MNASSSQRPAKETQEERVRRLQREAFQKRLMNDVYNKERTRQKRIDAARAIQIAWRACLLRRRLRRRIRARAVAGWAFLAAHRRKWFLIMRHASTILQSWYRGSMERAAFLYYRSLVGVEKAAAAETFRNSFLEPAGAAPLPSPRLSSSFLASRSRFQDAAVSPFATPHLPRAAARTPLAAAARPRAAHGGRPPTLGSPNLSPIRAAPDGMESLDVLLLALPGGPPRVEQRPRRLPAGLRRHFEPLPRGGAAASPGAEALRAGLQGYRVRRLLRAPAVRSLVDQDVARLMADVAAHRRAARAGTRPPMTAAERDFAELLPVQAARKKEELAALLAALLRGNPDAWSLLRRAQRPAGKQASRTALLRRKEREAAAAKEKESEGDGEADGEQPAPPSARTRPAAGAKSRAAGRAAGPPSARAAGDEAAEAGGPSSAAETAQAPATRAKKAGRGAAAKEKDGEKEREKEKEGPGAGPSGLGRSNSVQSGSGAGSEEGKARDFLRRKTQKPAPGKVDWSKVQRRVDSRLDPSLDPQARKKPRNPPSGPSSNPSSAPPSRPRTPLSSAPPSVTASAASMPPGAAAAHPGPLPPPGGQAVGSPPGKGSPGGVLPGEEASLSQRSLRSPPHSPPTSPGPPPRPRRAPPRAPPRLRLPAQLPLRRPSSLPASDSQRSLPGPSRPPRPRARVPARPPTPSAPSAPPSTGRPSGPPRAPSLLLLLLLARAPPPPPRGPTPQEGGPGKAGRPAFDPRSPHRPLDAVDRLLLDYVALYGALPDHDPGDEWTWQYFPRRPDTAVPQLHRGAAFFSMYADAQYAAELRALQRRTRAAAAAAAAPAAPNHE
eukprot:tig00021127_g18858.t1